MEIKNILTGLFHVLPIGLLKKIEPICAVFIDGNLLERRLMERYAAYLEKHFEDECKKILAQKKIMLIDESNLKFATFNITYMNIALSHMLYAMYNGCIPVLKDNKQELSWGWYFKQPYTVVPAWSGGILMDSR